MKLEQNVIRPQSLVPLIGMSLALVGVPMGMYLNHFFPIIKWSPIMMVISFLLSINWKFYRSYPYFLFPSSLGIVLFFIILLLFEIFLGDGFATTPFYQMLFVLTFIFALATHKKEVNYDIFPRVLFFSSLPCLILGIIVCHLNLVIGENAYFGRLENTFYALEPFSVAIGALMNMFSLICINHRTRLEYVLSIFFLIAGLYVISSCERRTPLFVFIVGVFYRFYSDFYSFEKIPKKLVITFVTCFSFVVLSYFFIPFISDRIDHFFSEMYLGIMNLFGNTSVSDASGSAIMRYEYRKYAYEYIDIHMNWVNYFFGVGFNKIVQIDNPILHIFIEMGILGVFGYVAIVVLYPLMIMKKKIQNSSVNLCVLLTLYAILSIINSGTPYMYIKYVPICILSVISYSLKNRGHSE